MLTKKTLFITKAQLRIFNLISCLVELVERESKMDALMSDKMIHLIQFMGKDVIKSIWGEILLMEHKCSSSRKRLVSAIMCETTSVLCRQSLHSMVEEANALMVKILQNWQNVPIFYIIYLQPSLKLGCDGAKQRKKKLTTGTRKKKETFYFFSTTEIFYFFTLHRFQFF